MNCRENNPECQSVFEHRDDAQKDDKRQNRESCMSFSVDVWMSSLVDFQHTQHAYYVHESRIYLEKQNQ